MSNISMIEATATTTMSRAAAKPAAPRRLRWAEADLGGIALRAGLAAVPFSGLVWLFVAR